MTEPIAKFHASRKSMILAIPSPGNGEDTLEKVEESLPGKRAPKGRFYAAKSFAIGSTVSRMAFLMLCLIISPFFIHAGTVRLINNSPYDLRAAIRGSDGSFLGEVVVKSQKETVWTDSYGQYGMYGGANPNVNQNYRSQTPYSVLWYCLDGTDYAVCDTVSTGAVVMAQSCAGARMCKPNRKEAYPQEPEGNYLYKNPKTPPLNQ